MNQTLILATVRQRLASPVRMVLLATMFIMPVLFVFFAPAAGLGPLSNGYGLTLVLAAGIIGQDVSSGVLQLLLARPVKRSEYVVSRWLSVSLMGALLATAQVLMAWLLLAGRHASPGPMAAFSRMGANALCAIGAAAVITFFSALLAGFGDLALLAVMAFVAGGLSGAGGFAHQAWISRAGTELGGFLLPEIPIGPVEGPGDIPWLAIVSYLSTVTLCLALAIVVMNRKELSYASSS
jgi:ABC-type transport system involved in multi-copper enzyme maturation permease subunit